MKVNIMPSIASGEIIVPPSKSYAHRMLIASSLSNEESVIRNIVLSKDIEATIDCIKTLGKDVLIEDDDVNKKITIKTKYTFNQLGDELIFNCNESGSTLRFFIPIALLTGKKVIFKGTEKLISRGIFPYEKICSEQGIEVIKEKDSITFKGVLKSDEFMIPGDISSQFITGLLFALPLLNNDSKIKIINKLESKNYVDITMDVLKNAGIQLEMNNLCITVYGKQTYLKGNYLVEGDYSNAAFLDAFNYIGGNVKILGLNKDSFQGDKVYIEYFKLLKKGFCTLDISNCIDLGPILFGISGMMFGAKFINTSRLKIKESDRIEAVRIELEKFGIILEEYDNEVIIKKGDLHKPNNILSGQNDHRIVMMLSVLLSKFGGVIDGCEAVSKSYPNFFEDIKKIGIEVNYDI